MLAWLISLINLLISLYSLCIITRTLLDILGSPLPELHTWLRKLTDPLLIPLRRHIQPVKMGNTYWDITPLIALLILYILQRILILIFL